MTLFTPPDATPFPEFRAVVRAALLGEVAPPVDESEVEAVARGLVELGLAGFLMVAQDRAGLRSPLGDRLRSVVQRQGFETQLRLETGDRASALLEEEGIPVLLFKGAALFRAGVYSDVRARPMSDVDLLVPPDRVEAAVTVLTGHQFRPWEPWTSQHLAWVSAFALEDLETPDGVSSSVDLHWATDYTRLRHDPMVGRETLWDGRRGRLPSPEAHLVLTAEHVLKHLRVVVHLPGVGDLIRLLPTVDDADEVRRQATVRRSLPGVQAMIGSLDLLGAAVPEALVTALGGRDRLRGRARRTRLQLDHLLARAAQERPLARDWLTLRGLGGTLWEVGRVLLPPPRWLRARYPDVPGQVGRRLRYTRDCLRWLGADGGSPLSPNQELG